MIHNNVIRSSLLLTSFKRVKEAENKMGRNYYLIIAENDL